MATAQLQRSTVSSVTLPNHIATEQESLVLLKRLFAVSISCITYLRGLFPEYAYGTRYLEDIAVKILREDKNCPGSTQLVKWIMGCYDALEKKYLRMAALAIYTNIDDPQTITECYHFKFKYTPAGTIMDFSSGKGSSVTAGLDVKKASVMLLRKLYILMQDLGPLPNNVCLSMKLLYYDDVTPADYQPPGFKEGSCDNLMFDGEPAYLNVGVVATPFHTLKCKVTTVKERMEHMDGNILKESDSKTSTHPVKMDIDEDKIPDGYLHDEPLRDHQADVQKKGIISSQLEDLVLSSQDNVVMETTNMLPSQLSKSGSFSTNRRTRSSGINSEKKPEPVKNIQTNLSSLSNKRQASKPTPALHIFGAQKEPLGSKKRKLSESKGPV